MSVKQGIEEMKAVRLVEGTGDFKTGWESAIEEIEVRLLDQPQPVTERRLTDEEIDNLSGDGLTE